MLLVMRAPKPTQDWRKRRREKGEAEDDEERTKMAVKRRETFARTESLSADRRKKDASAAGKKPYRNKTMSAYRKIEVIGEMEKMR